MTPFCSGFYIGGFSEEVCTLFSTPPLAFSVFFECSRCTCTTCTSPEYPSRAALTSARPFLLARLETKAFVGTRRIPSFDMRSNQAPLRMSKDFNPISTRRNV